jgi:hypothetical protein
MHKRYVVGQIFKPSFGQDSRPNLPQNNIKFKFKFNIVLEPNILNSNIDSVIYSISIKYFTQEY